MTQQERYKNIIAWFEKNRPNAQSELSYENPYQLLVAVILSAQCTDRRVNITTPALFERYPHPRDMAAATAEEIYPFIRSISYPNNKARHLAGMARVLTTEFGGIVPSAVEDLEKLPGVGRKTANVIASIVYNKGVIAVDTHVFRISHRLGLSDGKTPLKVEEDLSKNIPENRRALAHHWLILHGRYICTARKPHCPDCALSPFCLYYETQNTAQN